MFADQLIAAVVESLDNGSPAEVEQELADLQLLDYCRSALARWKEVEAGFSQE
jgi:hypothetical protein